MGMHLYSFTIRRAPPKKIGLHRTAGEQAIHARGTSIASEWKMVGTSAVDTVASKLEDLSVEDKGADDGDALALLLRRDDDEDAPQGSLPFVSGLVDMAGEVLRYGGGERFVCVLLSCFSC